MTSRYLVLLLALACTHKAERQATDADGGDSTLPTRSPLALRAPLPRSDTTRWADTTKRGDTTFYSLGRAITSTLVLTDSQWIQVTIPAIKPGLPFGIWQTPLDSICKTGYSSALVPVRDSAPIAAALDRAQSCGVRLVLSLPGPRARDANGLSVKVAKASLDRWPWAKVCGPYVRAIIEGDDLTHEQWGAYPTATRLAMWDSIWTYTLQKCPSAVTAARFRPTQIEAFPHPKSLKAMVAQYTGPKRHGAPAPFFASEVASAKRQGYGLLEGLNILNGGCGPATTGKCLPGIPGTSAAGGGDLYQMSADELKAYGSVILADQYACAFLSWAYGFGSDFFTKPANIAALDSLNQKASKRQPAPCIQRT